MNVQVKLTMPVLIAVILFAAVVHFYWAPRQYEQTRQQAFAHLEQEFLAMDSGLIRNLLENDYAAIYSTLNEQIRIHRGAWQDLTLIDSEGKRLYPVSEYEEKHLHEYFFPVSHKIEFEGILLGTIRLHVDWVEPFNAAKAQILKLEIYLMLTVGIMTLFILFWQREVILKPISRLQVATQKLAEGDFDYTLPRLSKDEFGQFTMAFESMRSEILSTHDQLEQAHFEMKKAFDEVAAKNIELSEEVGHRRKIQEQLNQMATHDELTNLPNRYLVKREAQKAIAAAQRYHHEVGFMFVDLDRFKAVNDMHGHEAGDVVLVEMSLRLADEVRDCDIVGRVGGDEFIVILPNCGSADDVQQTAQRIMFRLNQPIEAISIAEKVGASIGVAIYPDDGEEVDQLLHSADAAMYKSKQDHKANAELSTPG
jgi:diguanylate cyclase (GGDEF)-like protein